MDVIPNSQEWHRMKFLEVRIWNEERKEKNHKVSLWKFPKDFSCENEVSKETALLSIYLLKFPPQSAAIMKKND